MQKVFEKIIEKLEGKLEELEKVSNFKLSQKQKAQNYGYFVAIDHAIVIVEEVAAEYNNGWIPVEDELPDHNIDVEVTLASGIRHIAWYSSIRESWIDTLSDNERAIDVIAWRRPTEPYQPKEE